MRLLPIAIGAPDDAPITNALIVNTCVKIAGQHAARACRKLSTVTANPSSTGKPPRRRRSD